jgi:dTDP-4-dehydrorhamnose 3,5-epimerase
MTFVETKVKGAFIIKPKIFDDERGSFHEKWNFAVYNEKLGIDHGFAQMNQSKSKENVLRGLHYQSEHPQAKLVWVTCGIILDVFVDIRKDSPTYGKWDSHMFSIGNRNDVLYVPAGCAHGFMVQSAEGHFNYLVSDYRYPEFERTLLWNDPYLKIDWQLQKPNMEIRKPILSDKDKKGHLFRDL